MRLALLPAVLVVAGCAGGTGRGRAALPAAGPSPDYRLGCSDVVLVAVAGRPECDGVASVGLDGRLPLGPAGDAPADGGTLADLHGAVAAAAGVPVEDVTVTLADARAGRIYLVGPENGRQRSVPYVGPEPVVAFLVRAGAVPPGKADLRDVQVVRPNVAAGGDAQTMRVNVAAIARAGDDAANVVLEPSDVVTVGETRRSRFARLLPGWARPGYRQLVGLGRD